VKNSSVALVPSSPAATKHCLTLTRKASCSGACCGIAKVELLQRPACYKVAPKLFSLSKHGVALPGYAQRATSFAALTSSSPAAKVSGGVACAVLCCAVLCCIS
jgi:hypothetical protein